MLTFKSSITNAIQSTRVIERPLLSVWNLHISRPMSTRFRVQWCSVRSIRSVLVLGLLFLVPSIISISSFSVEIFQVFASHQRKQVNFQVTLHPLGNVNTGWFVTVENFKPADTAYRLSSQSEDKVTGWSANGWIPRCFLLRRLV